MEHCFKEFCAHKNPLEGSLTVGGEAVPSEFLSQGGV